MFTIQVTDSYVYFHTKHTKYLCGEDNKVHFNHITYNLFRSKK